MNSANLRAAALLVLAMLLLTLNDTCVKLITESLSVSQSLFVRGCIAVALFALYLKAIGKPVFSANIIAPSCTLRGLCEVGATSCYVYTLSKAPIALATTLLWIAPFFMTIFGALVLKEKVGYLRWLAVCMGFIGMLFITRPFGLDFDPILLLPVCAAVFLACRDLITARIPNVIHTAHVTFTSLILVTLFSAVVAIFNWQPLTGKLWLLLILSAALLSSSFLLHVHAIRLGELSFVAPFTFSNIVFALMMGYLVWGDIPNTFMLIGIALIIGACAYLFHSDTSTKSKH